MARRLDVLPFSLALLASLALHVVFVLALPGTLVRRPAAVPDVVVVDLAPVPEVPAAPSSPPARAAELAPAGSSSEEAPAPEETVPPSAAPEPNRASPEAPSPVAAAPTSSQAGVPAPSPTAAVQAPAGRPSGLAAPPPSLSARPAPTLSVAPSAVPPAGPSVPRLSQLMPVRRDLASLRSPARLPDPAAEGAGEATLGLGETDERYRGYRQHVEEAIYGAWRVGKALVVAGGNRSVLLRFTIDDAGIAQDVRVVETSGNPTLDAEAVEAVRRARIPPFPTHWTIRRLTLMAQFDYLFR